MVWCFSRHNGGESSNSSVLGWLVGIKPHVYQGFPSIWLFNDCLYTYFCQFYRPLWSIPCRLKCFGFPLGSMEVERGTSKSSLLRWLVAIRPHDYQGFPLYGYLMTMDSFSPVVNYSASSKMVRFFSRHYAGETSKSSALWRSIGITPHVYQGFPPICVFNDCLHT